MQVRKTEIIKPISNNTNSILSVNFSKDVLEGLSSLFPDCRPLDKVVQVYISLVGIIKHFKHYNIKKSDTYGPDTMNCYLNISTRLKLIFIARPEIRKNVLKKKRQYRYLGLKLGKKLA